MRYDLLPDEQEVKKYKPSLRKWPFVDELRQGCAGQREQQCREHFVTKKEVKIPGAVWQSPTLILLCSMHTYKSLLDTVISLTVQHGFM